MRSADVHEAETNLSELLDAAERGEQVIITRGINRFALVVAPLPDRATLFGALRGRIRYAEDYDQADVEISDMFDAPSS